MRNTVNINRGWRFSKTADTAPAAPVPDWEQVDLPHTWNGLDGQDGGNDYYRGKCFYVKTLSRADLPEGACVYLELNGANSSAEVYLNGKKLAVHHGGYSTFRVNLTADLQAENVLAVAVDNSPNDSVYPQMADFTFYGGLYRDVNLIGVEKEHFDLDYHGSSGLMVTPVVEGKTATVTAQAFLTEAGAQYTVQFILQDNGTVIQEKAVSAEDAKTEFVIENAHLWNGVFDPHLYMLEARLLCGDTVLDSVSARFGCRSFQIDPEKGFILNGKSYPLRGVSRHQDRPEIGNALLYEHHLEDINLICEMGANTVRLAHYQHAQAFYDLCDERGLVVWAEIPYISKQLPNGRDNTLSQMTELICQNYNHPCIAVWGLSNEITMGGASDAQLIENHEALNQLAHTLDPTRPTAMAVVSMCPPDEKYIQIPDIVSYNHYFGWYGGNTDMNGPWFDRFHAKYPDIAIGLSEYGCEALDWHTSTPEQGDYTEEYQAYYHEELIKQIIDRPYLWATHVWNMFDFAADARAEGGENGMNHKGLVTFDRAYKKDAFYAYKAWLSDEPFVHICAKRYTERTEDETKVTVYSNCDTVELFANGERVGIQHKTKYPFFCFTVKNSGVTKLTAKAGAYTDTSVIEKTEVFNEKYRMTQEGAVINWFEISTPEGCFSVNDTIGDILSTFRGKLFALKMMKTVKEMLGGGEEEKGEKDKKEKSSAMGFELNKTMLEMAKGFTVKRVLMMVGGHLSKEQILEINAELNKIKKK